jgi:hypothetical protein
VYEYAYEIGIVGSFATAAFKKIVQSPLSGHVLATYIDEFAAQYAASYVRKNPGPG